MPETIRTRAARPEHLLFLMAFAASLAFSVWEVLLNNFAIDRAAFTGREIGILQSIREIPGFLAFTTVFVLLALREQTFAVLSLALLGLGVAMTGLLPSEYGLYFSTLVMSTGFHYFFTLQQSLALQWIDVERTPVVLGRVASFTSVAALVGYAAVWLGMSRLGTGYVTLYLCAGGLALVLVLLAWVGFPAFPHAVPQRRHLLLRRRYWLYYALVFLSGARRQIFIVFASFLMVEKFNYSPADLALLFIANHAINSLLAPRIGHFIARFGERRAMAIEYSGLVAIFVSYALVQTAWIAAMLYVLDHILYAMAITLKSYFQKIADRGDIASTSSVSFTINHIAAVVIPVSFGLIWLHSPAIVFLAGAALAGIQLLLSRLVPSEPRVGNEVAFAS